MLLAACAAPAQVRLPEIGDPASAVISGAVERELGEAFMRELRATAEIVDDPEVEAYVQSLGYHLVASADHQDLGFNFFVVKDPAINAFAAPGGWVGIDTGLVVATESESELAAVLAHEISHVTQRHIARAIELNERSSITTLAGILAAIAIGTQSPQAGSATAAAVLGSQAQSQLNFTRANEHEADRVGMQLLDSAGFDPAAMANFFEKLQTASRYYQKPPEFLSTHPVTTARIAEARDRAAQLGFRQHSDGVAYQMVRAKIQVLTRTDNERLLEEFDDAIKHATPATSTGPRYGRALLKARMGRLDEARAELEALRKDLPDNTALRVATAQVVMSMGKEADALAMLDDSWRLIPDNRLVTRAYVDALLLARHSEQALKVLDEHQRVAGLDSEMQRQKAQALENLGRTAESQAALAEHYYNQGQLDRAIHQLTLASQHPDNDFYRASRIEARLEEMRNEQAARAKR